MAAVVAAGLNASYHDGDLQWVHRIAEQAKHRTLAVLALASGRADQFLTQAEILAAREKAQQDSSFAVAIEPLQIESTVSDASVRRAEGQVACKELQRARVEIQRARTQARIDANAARFQVMQVQLDRTFNAMPAAFNPMKTPACPRIRVVLPQIPGVRVPAVHINTASTDPV